MMPNRSFRSVTLAVLALSAACSESTRPPGEPGPPAQLVVVQGGSQSVPANTDVPLPIRVSVQDVAGIPVGAGQSVTFAVVSGGGSITGPSTVVSESDGTVTAPTWRLGRTNVGQVMRATMGTLQVDIQAVIATQYNIVVRYFGDPVSQANQLLFESAAARLEAIITGDIVDASATNLDLSGSLGCNTPGLPTVNETVDDIVVYAAITTMDGQGNVLGQATPCVGRRHPNTSGVTMVAYGYMKFDIADFASIANPQEVILHEMLHILGSGTLWETDRNLISGKLGPDPRFLGTLARAACAGLGATVTCATTVPLEDQGGTGTRDFHWRESAFNNELMTGFYNSGFNPLSTMTIASMADLGFEVNNAPADPYNFVGTMQLSQVGPGLPAGWEQVGTLRGMLRPDGKVEAIKR